MATQRLVKWCDQTASDSAVIVNDDQLVFNAVSGTVYRIEGWIRFETDDVECGIALGLQAPDANVFKGRIEIPEAGNDSDSFLFTYEIDETTTSGMTEQRYAAEGIATLVAIVKPTENGPIGLTFTTETDEVTVTVLKYSMLLVSST